MLGLQHLYNAKGRAVAELRQTGIILGLSPKGVVCFFFSILAESMKAGAYCEAALTAMLSHVCVLGLHWFVYYTV